MLNSYVSQLREGMDVFDIHDDKIGSIDEIYSPSSVSPPDSRTHDGYFKVLTGFLGLGETRFFPFSRIRKITDKRVYIDLDKDHLDDYSAEPIATLARR